MNIAATLKDRVTFIVGSKKNAGKTAFLNYALESLRPGTGVAYLSVGVDGERSDAVFGHPKPQIRAQKGDLLVTAETTLPASEASFEVLNVYPARTALGRLVLLRALREGRVELTGPENNTQLSAILSDLEKHKASTILVDGAVDRMTQAASHKKARLVYVARVEPENLQSALDAIKLIYAASKAPTYSNCESLFATEGGTILRQGGRALVPGAVTKTKLEGLLKTDKELVFEDPTKLFITHAEWAGLVKKYAVYFAMKPELSALIVNLYNVSKDDFLRKLDLPGLEAKLVFNPYTA
ncbi:MAG: hypothetical protein WCW52_05620 [Elusimicrobiales bacterium]|jgi:hypothetical protein